MTPRDVLAKWLSSPSHLSSRADQADELIGFLSAAGFFIGPRVPTPEMRDAAALFVGPDFTPADARDVWDEMIAAWKKSND